MIVETLSVSGQGVDLKVPELVQLACTFKSRITIRSNHCNYNAKSIMGMMSMDPREGTLQICADGDDEKEALAAVVLFFRSGQ